MPDGRSLNHTSPEKTEAPAGATASKPKPVPRGWPTPKSSRFDPHGSGFSGPPKGRPNRRWGGAAR